MVLMQAHIDAWSLSREIAQETLTVVHCLAVLLLLLLTLCAFFT